MVLAQQKVILMCKTTENVYFSSDWLELEL